MPRFLPLPEELEHRIAVLETASLKPVFPIPVQSCMYAASRRFRRHLKRAE
ncbi:hypothetical protein NEIPOLOT_02588 [Neisseria polysaccharea ATCC 43768]|nr:hypothetical protein NEIPOLOT_02588 [Neisseria polysaccharea ATCC 43768]